MGRNWSDGFTRTSPINIFIEVHIQINRSLRFESRLLPTAVLQPLSAPLSGLLLWGRAKLLKPVFDAEINRPSNVYFNIDLYRDFSYIGFQVIFVCKITIFQQTSIVYARSILSDNFTGNCQEYIICNDNSQKRRFHGESSEMQVLHVKCRFYGQFSKQARATGEAAFGKHSWPENTGPNQSASCAPLGPGPGPYGPISQPTCPRPILVNIL